MVGSSSVPHRRAIPKQARAAATLEKILDAAVGVLVERGLPGFNTNVVAEAAGVNVATLYHYFPDKNAILLELFHRNERARIGFVVGHLQKLADADGLRAWVAELIGHLLEVRLHEPAGVQLRRAWRAVPELREFEETRNAQLEAAIGSALAKRFPAQPRERLVTSAKMLHTTAVAVLDTGIEQPEGAHALSAELVELVYHYLASLEA